MQLLIISSLKSVSRYVSYREASIAICIVLWGECIVAALMYVYHIDINVSAEIDEYPSLRFQDIRKNQSVTDRHNDGWTDHMKTVYPTTNKVCGGYNEIALQVYGNL